jgi:serralysin
VVGAISTTDLDTLNVLGYSLAPSCFCAGAMVATPDGEAAVETLRRGDPVRTLDGRVVPIVWIGRQTVMRRFADPLRLAPVRVKAGALGDNIPCRDLLLSAEHALFVGGVLIQAGALVNGTSIRREWDMPETFVYYHVETEDHALILVDDAAAETFVDNAERRRFDNWAEHAALYPEGRSIPELPLPRVKARRQLPSSLRAALDRRALALGEAAPAAA